jgi:hypothetical protein
MSDELTAEQQFGAKLFGVEPKPDPEPSKDESEAEGEKAQPQGLGAETQPSDPVEEHNALLAQLLRGPVPVEEPHE